MSTAGGTRHFSMTVASGITLSSGLDLGGSYGNVCLGIPTMSSGSDIRPWVAGEIDGTYRKLFHRAGAVSAVVVAVNYDSSITQAFVPLDLGGARFIKMELGSAMTDTVTAFDIICGPN